MKPLILFQFISVLFAACNYSDSMKSGKNDSTDTEKINYPYSIKEMPNWEIGDPKNALILLNFLKAFETNNVPEMSQFLADSVTHAADNFFFSGPKDSLLSIFTTHRGGVTNVTFEMADWETVHGKNNHEDWVSAWYKAKWIDNSGISDSAYFMTDAKIVNGKIRVIDDKVRHYPKSL